MKSISMLEKNPLRFNYKPKLCQNAALSLKWMHLNIPSTECWRLCRPASSSSTVWVRAVLMRGRSLLGQYPGTLDIWLWWHNLSPPNFLRHDLCLYYSFLSMISYFHRNSVIRRPIYMHWIRLHNDRHLFADCFVTVGPIAMKFGWGLENVSSLKFRKFQLNQSDFTRKLTLMFKLHLKKLRLTHLDTRCRTGQCTKLIYFAQEITTCMHFMDPPKNRRDWMRASC